MDLPSLAVILQAALSPNPEERKAAEQNLNQFQYAPQHLVRLLQIIVDNNCDMGVRQNASIHFKNFIAKNWSPDSDSDTQQKILQSDKDLVRDHILMFVTQVPPLLRVQLGECLKTIIHADYPEQWPRLLDWVKHNLQDQQVYGALFVLRILSRKYEFKSDEERTPVYRIVDETFPHLLNIFNRLIQIVNPSLEIADLIKLICKIFWSSIYLEIPKLLFDQNIFNAWMILFLNVLERPVPSEGEPVDPDLRKSWGWWKVKKWTVHILNRLYTRFGDLKLQNPETRAFAQMFQKHYAGKILECHLNLLNVIRVGGYLPDRVINLILQYLSNSISRNSMYALLQPRLDVLLFEIVFPLMCFSDNDQKLWEEDPHEYVRKGYDIIEDLYSPRTASMDFVSELVRKRGKENLHKFIQFIVEIFRRYDEASIEFKPYRQKDGALLAIGALCDKLKQTEPYKSELERMLVQHVFPEFNSPVGHLRAKAAWVAGQYAHISFSDQNNFRKALQCVVSRMQDSELPVRVDSVFALRSFIEACKDLNEIRPILPQLLDEFFKLMNEVENEDLVFTLETIVDKFGEEMAPYALGLCQNLAAAFWRCMNSAEADDEVDDPGALAAVVVVLFMSWWFLMKKENNNEIKIPKGNSGWPLIGETLDFVASCYSSRPVTFMENRKSIYGDVFKTNILGSNLIISTDPEVNKVILHNQKNIFIPAYPKSIKELMGEHSILQLNGNKHKKLHSIIAVFLKSPQFKARITTDIEHSVKQRLASWTNKTIYIQDEVKKITFPILNKVLMSLGPGEDLDLLKREFEVFIKGLICLPIKFPGTTLYKSLKAKERMMKMVRKIVEERKNQIVDNNEVNDVVDVLLRGKDELSQSSSSSSNLELEMISQNIIEMMIPGEETLPTAMTLALKFLSDSPLALSKLMEENMELKKQKTDNSEDYRWTDYMSLPFTQNVISETLRMANIVNGIWRKAVQDVEIKGYLIPKNWSVMACLISVHLDPKNYENPFKFDPWRWEKIEVLASNIRFAPFGGGHRLCPGLELSRLELSIFLHNLVTTYRWVAEKDEIVYFPTVKMKKKLPIRVQPINA